MLEAARGVVNRPTQEGLARFHQAYSEFVGVSRTNNTTFLLLCLDAYRKRLQPGANGRPLH